MRLRFVAVCSAALVLSIASFAEAQASRTWVSGVGDDVNPCSRTAPCKTFAGAISKTADKGYINVLDSAGYGAVTINKSITIDGGPMHAGALTSAQGIIINSATAKVVIRNLDIEGVTGATFGINVISAASVHIENVRILNFSNFGINHNPSGAGAPLFVDNVTVENTLGVQIVNARAHVNGSRIEGGNKGVIVGANALVTIRDTIASGNAEGFSAVVGSAIINLENCVATSNTFGLAATSGSTIRVSNTHVLSNTNTGLFNDGSSFIVSLGGNDVQGNPTPGTFTSTLPKQ